MKIIPHTTIGNVVLKFVIDKNSNFYFIGIKRLSITIKDYVPKNVKDALYEPTYDF